MNNLSWFEIVLLALTAAWCTPALIYFAVKAGRYGWLRAEQLFFGNDNPNEEK
jgi:hypothetical protein